MKILMKFKNFIFRKCKRSTHGTLCLLSSNMEPVTVKKKIRYSIRKGDSTIHVNTYADLVEFCKTSNYRTTDGKKL